MQSALLSIEHQRTCNMCRSDDNIYKERKQEGCNYVQEPDGD